MLVEVERMEAAEPRSMQNEFSTADRDADGNIVITNERFKTRVRASDRVSTKWRYLAAS